MLGSVLGTVGSAAAGAEVNNGSIDDLKATMRADDEEYRRLLARNYMDSPENAGLMRRLHEMQRDRYNQARATNVVAGGTDSHLAAMQMAGDKVVSDTGNSIAQRSQTAKDALRSERRQVKRANAEKMFGLGQQKAQAIAKGGEGVSRAMAGLAAAGGVTENPYDIFGLGTPDAYTMGRAQESIDSVTEASVQQQLADSLQETLDELEKKGY